MSKPQRCAITLLFLVAAALSQQASAQVSSQEPRTAVNKPLSTAPVVFYTIRLGDPSQHIVHVRMEAARNTGLPASDQGPSFRRVQLPVWNALYQVRDFSQFILQVSAQDAHGSPVTVRDVDKTTWDVSPATRVDYDVFVDSPGPYSAQFSPDHAFFNLADILMYGTDRRDRPVAVSFENVPDGWSTATVLNSGFDSDAGTRLFGAANYDALVDSPVEIGRYRELSFEQGGTRYRIAIDAPPADYDANKIEDSVRRIVAAEAEWMDDRPCAEYLFIYHFPRGFGGGGMEHACSTAIDLPAERLSSDFVSFQGVTAHEFFHLWNVKRIRPQSLEPVDYAREQYTRALWFSEGVTSTVEDYILLRAGLIGEPEYLHRLGAEINTLQQRPAHRTQSAEESSLETWFDKYPFYRRAERSISYYNKGEILGAMLDLAMRDATEGKGTLRDLFQWLNVHYAKQKRFFEDSQGIREAVQTVTGKEFSAFFRDYVAGVEEIPYDWFLNTAGLRLVQQQVVLADPGLSVSRNFDGFPVVTAVNADSEAARTGVHAGDTVVEINSKRNANLEDEIMSMTPGDTLRMRIRSGGQKERDIKLKLGSRKESRLSIVDMEQPTPAQMARRAQWLGTPAGATRPASTVTALPRPETSPAGAARP